MATAPRVSRTNNAVSVTSTGGDAKIAHVVGVAVRMFMAA
jgi:hypothetical protein